MNNSPIFLFRDDRDGGSYDLYLFKDFSGTKTTHSDNIFNILNEVRLRVHIPDTLFIICIDGSDLDKEKYCERFLKGQKIEYINYKDIDENIFKIGIRQIVKDNKVVQYAPHGTIFKKTSDKESYYFIKASLALSDYPKICFLSLALHQKITKEKILSIKKFYIDTSSIMPLIQALIFYQNMTGNNEFSPEIINFKSYNKHNINFNFSGLYTVISASSAGGLQEKYHISEDKCITIFLPKSVGKNNLFEVDIQNNQSSGQEKPIPLISEDFSLEYSKSEEVIITKLNIEKLDTTKTIKKLLHDDFKKVDYKFEYDEILNTKLINFNDGFIDKLLKDFKEKSINRCLLSKKDNYIICENTADKVIGVEFFLKLDISNTDLNDKNIIVCLDQSDKNKLIQISQKLRDYKIFNVTYIIGILLTKSISESKNLQNNICFNDSENKYGFYCYLDLPLLNITQPDLLQHKLSDGFVFYDGEESSELCQKQVYLAICFILELLRNDKKLSDNISFHNVISPKNFSRFNDPLLQLSILFAAKGRELNFFSNSDLSYEMSNIVMDLTKQNKDIGKIFIKAIESKKIALTEKDIDLIKWEYRSLFEEEKRV